MAPILPGLSDRPEQLAEVVKAARAAGATSVWANLLYLKPGTREHFLEALARDWPEELERYEQLLRGARVSSARRRSTRCASRCAPWPASTASATGAGSRCDRRRSPSS